MFMKEGRCVAAPATYPIINEVKEGENGKEVREETQQNRAA
jgi:hypothetical protein